MPDFRIQTVKVGKQTFFYLEYPGTQILKLFPLSQIANPQIFMINLQIHKSLKKILHNSVLCLKTVREVVFEKLIIILN